jgi:hypothetical protein
MLLDSVTSCALASSADRAAADRRQQPRKAEAKGSHRRRVAHLQKVKSDRLEQPLRLLAFGDIESLIRQQAGIHHADNPPPRIHHRERQELVQHERLARLHHRRGLKYGHHARNHQIGQPLLQRRCQQPAGRQDTGQPVLRIHHVEIDDLLPNPALPDGVQRLLYGEVLAQHRHVLARDRQHGLMQVVWFSRHTHFIITQVRGKIRQ